MSEINRKSSQNRPNSGSSNRSSSNVRSGQAGYRGNSGKSERTENPRSKEYKREYVSKRSEEGKRFSENKGESADRQGRPTSTTRYGKPENQDRSGRSASSVRYSKSDKSDRSERQGRSTSSERYGKSERSDRDGRSTSTERYGKSERSDRDGRSASSERYGKSEGPDRNGKSGRSTSSERYGKTERSDRDRRSASSERYGKSERSDRGGKSTSSERYGKSERSDRDGRSASLERYGKSERSDRGGKSASSDRYNKTDNSDRRGRSTTSDRFVKSEKSERTGRSTSSERYSKSENSDRQGRHVTITRYSENDDSIKEDTNMDKKHTRKAGADRRTKEYGHKVIDKDACPYIRECGGCQILERSYKEQLMEKQKTVDSLIKKYCKVEPIIGMENPTHYRNKVHTVFDHDRYGNPISGIYEEGTHRVIPIDSCLIHNEKADEIIVTIRNLLKSFKIKTYDEDTEYGLLRHVLVRTGFTSGEIMVVLVISSPIFPSKNNFVRVLRSAHPEITTIVLNVNDKSTSMVLGDKENVIYGKGYIEDTLCGKTFRISPKSFYQVNPVQTEVVYRKAIEMAELKGTETVVDAYSGIGTIGLIAADHVKKVIGVELNKDAVRDAVTNAKRNQINNVEFYTQDAGEFLRQMAEVKETVDLVFMDPPRTGSDEQFLSSMVTLKPEKVIYISCNPVTLERDLAYLTKKGYKAEKAIPVDMFPWTTHVETVVLMSRKDK